MEDQALLREQLRRNDYDRYLTTLLAPDLHQEPLLALYCLNAGLEGLADRVAEPMLGRIRLQWWRDELARLVDGGARPEAPELRGLAKPIADGRLALADLHEWIDGHEAALDHAEADVVTVDDLLAWAEGAGGGVARLVVGLLDPDAGASARDAAIKAGAAVALGRLLCGVAVKVAQGQSGLPPALLDGAEVARDAMAKGAADPALVSLVGDLEGQARRLIREARDLCPRPTRQAIAAFLPVVPIEARLNRLAAQGFDPFAPDLLRPHGIGRPMRIMWRGWRRRF